MSAVYANVSNQLAALKELYSGGDYMQDLVYRKNPFLALVPKDESPSGFAGKYIPVPLIYGSNQGRSATFTNAQNQQTPAQLASFFVYRVANYSLATISNELLEATVSDAGAFLDEGKLQVDSAIRSISNDVALDLFRGGDGYRGAISALSTGVITLTNANDVVNFEVGMTLVSFSVSGATATISTSGALGYVIAVDRDAGTVTVSNTSVSGSAADPASWGTSFPNLAVYGDNPLTASATTFTIGTSANQKMSGLSAWIPVSLGASDSFWGVNRNADRSRLAGNYFDGSAETIEEALIDGVSLVAREGGEPDMAFVNFTSWSALEKELGAKVQYVQVKHDTADVAFKGITVNAPYGPITVIADRSVPAQTCFALEMDTWKLRTLGKCPHILTYGREGLEGIRVGNADALEVRVGLYGNLICNAPGWNVRIKLSV